MEDFDSPSTELLSSIVAETSSVVTKYSFHDIRRGRKRIHWSLGSFGIRLHHHPENSLPMQKLGTNVLLRTVTLDVPFVVLIGPNMS